MQAWCLKRPEEGIRSPGIVITEAWKLPGGCRELNLGPLQERQVLLTTEKSLQPRGQLIFIIIVSLLEYSPSKSPTSKPLSQCLTFENIVQDRNCQKCTQELP